MRHSASMGQLHTAPSWLVSPPPHSYLSMVWLTRWGRVTHICVSKLNISSDNGLSPGQRQAIIWSNAGILLFWTLGTNSSEVLSELNTFSLRKMPLKTSSAKWWQIFLASMRLKFIHVSERGTVGLLRILCKKKKQLGYDGAIHAHCLLFSQTSGKWCLSSSLNLKARLVSFVEQSVPHEQDN